MSVMMEEIGESIWLRRYPLIVLGADIERNVTCLRLQSGEVIVHSTAPFGVAEVTEIRRLGDPRWICEPMLDHDTFSSEGHAAFPEADFFAPPGFAERVEFPVASLREPPAEWLGEVEFLEIAGAPGFSEYVCFHYRSRTLIVADLIFNFAGKHSLWFRILLWGAIGRRFAPGFSRRFKAAIEDQEAFAGSLKRVLALDFQQVVVGHGEVLRDDAKRKMGEVFRAEGLL